ncbi:MAG: hypothetical protein RLZZ157_487, partial [Pseudomonadota bacterium]
PRYSEATLVKKMEELGIGRPSTYASVLGVLRDREYVVMDKNRFVPEDKGRLVTAFLENFFARYVEYDFTAALEERLDLVSSGDLNWKVLLREFWADFSKAVADTGDLRTTQVLDAINESLGHHIFPDKGDGKDPRACPSCADGRLSLKTSKFGAFIGCTNYPECKFTRQLGASAQGKAGGGDRSLGTDPETGLEVMLKNGRFGPYVQLGEGDKPKRSSLPKGWQESDLDLAAALKLLSLPRTVGLHPEDGEPIFANLGRFGPYIQHGKTYANVGSIEDVFEVGINRAVTLIAEKRAGGGRPQRGAPVPPIKEFAPSAEGEPTIKVLAGRFGPYVTDGTTNATIPKGQNPADMDLETAQALIAARVALVGVGGSKKKPARKAASAATTKKAPAKKKAPAAKPTAKKAPTAKKPPAKKTKPS